MPVPNVQWITPDDGRRNCPKHVEFRTRINLEISASVGFIVKKFVTIDHGHMNVKFFISHSNLYVPLIITKTRCIQAGRKNSLYPYNRRLSGTQTPLGRFGGTVGNVRPVTQSLNVSVAPSAMYVL
jgi:hypothetical protein